MAAATKMIEAHSKGAEIYHGAICKDKLHQILDEFSVPRCIFFKNELIEELGLDRSSGFLWMKRKSKSERKIDKLGTTYCDTLVTGFIEPRRLSKITGVKAKERLVAITVYEILVGVPTSDKVKFISNVGIYRAHPIAVFETHVDKINGN